MFAGDADGGVLLGQALDGQRFVDLARVVEFVALAGEHGAVAAGRAMPRAWSLVSVLLPQSRMMRSADGFDTTVAITVSAQSSSVAAPSATCVRSK